MNIVFKTFFYEVLCILFFTLIYYHYEDNFYYNPVNTKNNGNYNNKNDNINIVDKSLLDYFLLSVTIQCSTGMSQLIPITNLGKAILVIHQLCVLFTHIISVYLLSYL